jgi:hypothetical protein
MECCCRPCKAEGVFYKCSLFPSNRKYWTHFLFISVLHCVRKWSPPLAEIATPTIVLYVCTSMDPCEDAAYQCFCKNWRITSFIFRRLLHKEEGLPKCTNFASSPRNLFLKPHCQTFLPRTYEFAISLPLHSNWVF